LARLHPKETWIDADDNRESQALTLSPSPSPPQSSAEARETKNREASPEPERHENAAAALLAKEVGVSEDGIARLSNAIISGTTTEKRVMEVVENLKGRGINASGGLAMSLFLHPEKPLSSRAVPAKSTAGAGMAAKASPVNSLQRWAKLKAEDKADAFVAFRARYAENQDVLRKIGEVQNGNMVMPEKVAMELISLRNWTS
jgi:hypothetical protein